MGWGGGWGGVETCLVEVVKDEVVKVWVIPMLAHVTDCKVPCRTIRNRKVLQAYLSGINGLGSRV